MHDYPNFTYRMGVLATMDTRYIDGYPQLRRAIILSFVSRLVLTKCDFKVTTNGRI